MFYQIPAINNVSRNPELSDVKLSIPLTHSVLQNSYPPFSGDLKSNLVNTVTSPMLDFLNQKGSCFMVNAYPIFAYNDPYHLAELRFSAPRRESQMPTRGNLFDTMLDAMVWSICALGHKVTKTAWPPKGEEDETRVNIAFFNENKNPGMISQHLFYGREAKVYDIALIVEALKSQPPSANNTSPAPTANNMSTKPQTEGSETTCVVNSKAGDEAQLQAALDPCATEVSIDAGANV